MAVGRAIKEGDFAEIDFIGRVKSTGEIFDLTVEDAAKKENIYRSDAIYKPAFVIIGTGMILESLERILVGMEEGEEKTIDIEAKDAFGPRDASKIRVLPYSAFAKNEVMPAAGMFLEVDGKRCKVQSAGSGRVRADFNHPLAGKDVSYWVKVRRIIEKPEERASAYLQYLGIESTPAFSDGRLSIATKIRLDDKLREFFDGQLRKHMQEVKEIVFSEEKQEGEQKPKDEKAEGNQQ